MADKNDSIITIEDGIEAFSNGRVTKRKVFRYKGLILFALGVAAYILQFFDKEDGAMTIFLLIAGQFFGVVGLFIFLARKDNYFYDGKPMKMREFLFDSERFDDIMRLYNDGKFSEMLDVSRSSASKMKLKVLYATDYSVAFSQIYNFVGYDFVPAEQIRIHDKAQCNNLNSLVISY